MNDTIFSHQECKTNGEVWYRKITSYRLRLNKITSTCGKSLIVWNSSNFISHIRGGVRTVFTEVGGSAPCLVLRQWGLRRGAVLLRLHHEGAVIEGSVEAQMPLKQ